MLLYWTQFVHTICILLLWIRMFDLFRTNLVIIFVIITKLHLWNTTCKFGLVFKYSINTEGSVNLFSASEAVQTLHQQNVKEKAVTAVELIASDVLDHYRTYSLLERLLHNPPKLAEQLAFQIEPLTRQLLIERYKPIFDVKIIA